MSDGIEVIKVKADNEQGFIVINKSDMTKDHVAYVQVAEKPASKKAKE